MKIAENRFKRPKTAAIPTKSTQITHSQTHTQPMIACERKFQYRPFVWYLLFYATRMKAQRAKRRGKNNNNTNQQNEKNTHLEIYGKEQHT